MSQTRQNYLCAGDGSKVSALKMPKIKMVQRRIRTSELADG